MNVRNNAANFYGGSDPSVHLAAVTAKREMSVRTIIADLLLVTGDPTVDVRILKDQSNIVGVMKGGSFHRTPDPGIGALKDRRAA